MADPFFQELRYLLRLDPRPPWANQSPVDDIKGIFGYPPKDARTRATEYANEKAFQALNELNRKTGVLYDPNAFDRTMYEIEDWLDRTIPKSGP